MASNDKAGGSRFQVDLGDIKLPAVVEQQVQAEIQAAVLRALAQLDERGDARLKRPIFDQFPGQTLGLWLDPDRIPVLPGEGGLDPRDHTIIMRALMEHPFDVLRQVPNLSRDSRPSGQQALEAALHVDAIGVDVKARIRRVLDVLPAIEEAKANAPANLKQALDNVRVQLAGTSVDEQRRVLRDRELRQRHREVPGLSDGMELAAEMLADGSDSIYSPDFSFYRLMIQGTNARSTSRDAISDVASADTIGATVGGAVGSVGGGVGAGPGAVAGGAGASAGAVVGIAAAWVWSWFD